MSLIYQYLSPISLHSRKCDTLIPINLHMPIPTQYSQFVILYTSLWGHFIPPRIHGHLRRLRRKGRWERPQKHQVFISRILGEMGVLVEGIRIRNMIKYMCIFGGDEFIALPCCRTQWRIARNQMTKRTIHGMNRQHFDKCMKLWWNSTPFYRFCWWCSENHHCRWVSEQEALLPWASSKASSSDRKCWGFPDFSYTHHQNRIVLIQLNYTDYT